MPELQLARHCDHVAIRPCSYPLIRKFNRTAVGAAKRGPTPVLKVSSIRKVRGSTEAPGQGGRCRGGPAGTQSRSWQTRGLRAVIDLAGPVGVILAAVLNFVDVDAARAVATGYTRLIAPGSRLVISVACYYDEALGKRLSAEYTAATWHNHPRADVESFFAGLDLVGPASRRRRHGGHGCPCWY